MFPLLLPTAYAPPIDYFTYLYHYQGRTVQLEVNEHFVKQSIRNRTYISTANGVQALSIPLLGSNKTKTLIKDIQISEHGNWKRNHIQSIVSAYANTPFFEYYWCDIEPYYIKRYKYLLDFNTELLHKLASLIELDLETSCTQDYNFDNIDTLDLRYILDKRDEESKSSILSKLPYRQIFSERYGFIPNLSIFDLIFHKGPETLLYLRDCQSLNLLHVGSI